jgi:hypothetical protein
MKGQKNKIKRDQVTDSGMPCVRYGEIHTTYRHCRKNHILSPIEPDTKDTWPQRVSQSTFGF